HSAHVRDDIRGVGGSWSWHPGIQIPRFQQLRICRRPVDGHVVGATHTWTGAAGDGERVRAATLGQRQDGHEETICLAVSAGGEGRSLDRGGRAEREAGPRRRIVYDRDT